MSRLSSNAILHIVASSHTVQVFWAGMKIECFHSDGTITPLTAREKCSIQASRITKKLHETSHGASHDILVDRVRWTYRLELVLRWTDESPTSLHQADNRHCLKRSIMTVSWRLNCCYCFSQGRWEAQSSLPIGYACPDKEHTPLVSFTRPVFLPFAFFFSWRWLSGPSCWALNLSSSRDIPKPGLSI